MPFISGRELCVIAWGNYEFSEEFRSEECQEMVSKEGRPMEDFLSE